MTPSHVGMSCGDTVYIGLGTVALAVSSDEGLKPQQRIEKEMLIDGSTSCTCSDT